MSIQYVSTLPKFQKFSRKRQKFFILHCPKSLIQFLSELLVNLLRGELKELQKIDKVKYPREISELTRRRTSLHKRRSILRLPKCLQLISLITIFVIKRSTYPYSHLNLSITKYTSKKNWNKSMKKRRLYQKILILFTVL